MPLRMEIIFEKGFAILRGDQLYLEFEGEGEEAVVYLCLTNVPNLDQKSPKAKVVHAPTTEELY